MQPGYDRPASLIRQSFATPASMSWYALVNATRVGGKWISPTPCGAGQPATAL